MSTQRASLLSGLRTGGPRSIPNLGYSEGFQGLTLDGLAQQIASPISPIGPNQSRYPPLPHNRRSSTLHTAPLMLDASHPMSLDMLQSPVSAPVGDNMFAHYQQQQQQMMLLQAQMQSQTLHGNGRGGAQLPQYMSPEQQAMQLQLEVVKLQALQQQQNALLAHAQTPVSSPIGGFGPFSPRSQFQVDGAEGRYPGGKPRLGLNPNAASFQMHNVGTPTTPTATPTNWRQNGAVSGGTALGVASPKQHENAASWRRPSAVRQSSQASEQSARSSTPPTVFVSSPEETNRVLRSRSNSPPSQWAPSRPRSTNLQSSGPLQDGSAEDSDSSEDSVGGMREFVSSPTSTTSGGMFFGSPQSVAREEASRRLYEGLGIGRPVPTAANPIARSVSQPMRQPKGPPSVPEELGARNFASRIRSQGLGVLREHSARRQSQNLSVAIEAY